MGKGKKKDKIDNTRTVNNKIIFNIFKGIINNKGLSIVKGDCE